MPDDATGAEPPEPRWGDDLETIPHARRDELLALHAAQVKWLAETGPDRDLAQSPFAQASAWGRRLSGAEVYFLLHTVRAVLHLEGANLNSAHLEGGFLTDAHLERAFLTYTQRFFGK